MINNEYRDRYVPGEKPDWADMPSNLTNGEVENIKSWFFGTGVAAVIMGAAIAFTLSRIFF